MSEIKPKTIFDIMNDISFTKLPWNDQTEVGKKQTQTWMLNRFFSMHPEYLEVIAECQPLTDQLTPEMYYKFYSDLLPKKKFFAKYIKGKNDSDQSTKKLVEFLSDKLQTSFSEMEDYLEILLNGQQSEVKKFIRKFGYDDKGIKREFGL